MKAKYDTSFFKKVPWRMAHPDAPKTYDGYYTLVPRKHRFVMDEHMLRIQRACEKRAHALVEEAAARQKRRDPEPEPLFETVTVRTVKRSYRSRNDDTRELIREEQKVEQHRLLKSDYLALPLPFALSLHFANGDGLSLAEEDA